MFKHHDHGAPIARGCQGNGDRRRHLTTGQRSMIAARLANIQRGEVGGGHGKTDVSIEIPDAAALLNVSVSSVNRARKVLDEGTPEDIAAVEAGEKGVSAQENGEKKKARAVTSLSVDTYYGPREPIRTALSFDQAALCFSIWHAGASRNGPRVAERPRRFRGFLVLRSSPRFQPNAFSLTFPI